MSSSPNSNASSSDLYSPSDNPELVPAHPARTPTLVKEQPTEDYIALHLSHPNDQHGEPTAEGEQGTVEPGRRKPDTRDPSVYNTPNGDNNNGYHKRKRDEEEETSQDPLGQLSVSPLPGDAQHFGNFGRNGSPPQKRQLILEYWSRINRSDLQGDPTHSEGIRGHSRSSNLPDEIWQHIFSFVPPVFLGRLLRVNRVFHACLTMAIGEQSDQANSASNAVRPESTLYVSPDCPYFLLSALPFAFVTATNHFVSNAALQGMAHLPPLKMEKHYYKPHIEDIKRRLADAKALGAPSVEEWMKGLPSEGKERHDDAVRWEQWEARGGLKKVNAKAPAKQSSTPAIPKVGPSFPLSKTDGHPTPHNIALPAKPSVDFSTSTPPHSTDPSFPAAPVMSQFQPPWTPAVSYPEGFAQRAPGALPQSRPERNIRDVNEAKALRKAEIERRCQNLQPPLPSNILNHMESFQAAIQISQPLTEHAWEVLKPRLLAQRPYAERKEKEKIQQDELLQEEYKQRRQQETQLKETKEALDREWDTVQAPVRNRIGALADEIILDNWSNGDSVSKDTSPKFAADVLLFVRERFYAEIAQEDEQARIKGQPVMVDQANEPPTRKLILENMKWLFDTKIKPLTENFQKELFLCNGCEGNFKFYGFEGVIQHYAAKHTTTLSMGSVVVHWRAEWPEHPPFNANPTAAKAAYYKIPTPVSSSGQGPMNGDPQPQPSYGYGQRPDANAVSHHPQQVHHNMQALSETYSAPSTGSQHSAPYSYPAEQVYHPYPTANTGNVPIPPSNQGPSVGYTGPPQAMYTSSNQGYNNYPQASYGQPAPSYASQYPRLQYTSYSQGQEYNMPDPNNQYYGTNSIAQQPTGFAPRPVPLHPSGLAPDVYQKQLDELAKHAREVWFGTSGIKDIPQSVRIFVVIHHAASRFATSFSFEPTLAMFIDGLDNHPKMRPVRSLNGLACKTCVHASSSDGQQPYLQYPVADRKLYTLPHLLNHFRTAHLEANLGFPEHSAISPTTKPDWKRDMIELPELALIADLVNAPGVDDTKLGLIASVFPEAFPNPLPMMGKGSGNLGPVPIYRANSTSTNVPLPAAPVTHHDQARKADIPTNYQPFARPVSTLRISSSRAPSSEPPGEDEYDPHRPAYLGRIIRPETDAAYPRHQVNATSSTPFHPEQGPISHYNHNEAQYHATNGMSANHTANGLQVRGGNGDTGQYYPAEHVSGPAMTHESPVDAHSKGRFSEIYASPPERQIHHDSNQRAYNDNNGITYQRPTENVNPNDDQISVPYSNHITSPTEAADQFLRSFPVSKASHSNLHEQDAGSRSTSARLDAARTVDRDRKYNESVGTERWNGVQSGARQASDNHSIIDSIRAASLISKAVEDSASSQNLTAKARQDDEYRPPSHVQLSLSTSRVGQSPQPYDFHTSGRRMVPHQQYAVNDMDRPREDHASSYRQPREPQYRSRSKSPRLSQLERSFYRSRSPRVEARNESVYQVISPSSRKEHQPQRIVDYDYPAQERYEYIDNRVPTEDRYGRRVEYVPLRYEEPRPVENNRYFVAARYEEPVPPPGYVRLEQRYGGEQFYERDGQLYRAGPSPQAYSHEYRY